MTDATQITDAALAELRARALRMVDTGRRTLGGGSISCSWDGTSASGASYGGQPIMALANPDGPALIAALDEARAERDRAAADERAAIVRWMRHSARSLDLVPDDVESAAWRCMSVFIERGEHLPERGK